MNNLLKFNTILAIVFAIVQVYAADDTTLNTEFLTGKYEDNQIIDEWIGIRGVDGLEVRIEGETEENYDFIIIYNKKNCVKKLSGVMDTVFTVPGSSVIRVIFKSDERTTRDGAKVTVFPLSPASFFNEIRAQFLEATTHILKKGTSKIYADIVQNLSKFKELHLKIKESSEQKMEPFLEEVKVALIAMTKSYRQIAITSKNIIATHQSQLKIIEQLKKKTHVQIGKITKEREKLRKQQEKLVAKRDTGSTNSIEDRKIENDEKNIDSLNRLQKFWEDFAGVQDTLKDDLKAYSDNIQLLLHFLKVDAETYEQVANVISLRKTEPIVLDNLPGASKLEEVIDQIQCHEKEILKQFEKIKQTNF